MTIGEEDKVEIDDAIDSVVDDIIPGDALDKKQPQKIEKQEPLKKLSVREAINVALDEQDDKSKDKTPHKLGERKTENADTKTDDKSTQKVEKPAAPALVEKIQSKFSAPKGWTKEAKAEFDKLPEVVKASVAKREDEASNGFKEYGEKTRALEQYENLVKQYIPDHQNYGLTAPQMVERTFLWLKALQNPNKTTAVNSLKQLAQSFGLDNELAQAYVQNNSQPQHNVQQNNQQVIPQIPLEVIQTIQNLQSQVGNLRNEHNQNSTQVAQQQITKWSADKPHFDKVRGQMRILIESGAVPLKNGEIDLDEAYTRACRVDPEIYQEMLDAELIKKDEEFAAKEAERKAKQIENVNRARRANISIRPSAPSSPIQVDKNSKPKRMSVRESIDAALVESKGT